MNKKRKIFISIFVLILISISLIIIYSKYNNNETQQENINGEKIEDTLESEIKFQGKLELDKEASLGFPSELYTYKNIPIKLNKSVIKNLEKDGWQDHTFIDNGKGKYIIRCEKSDDSYTPTEKNVLEQAKSFVKDSGIEGVLDKENIKYEYTLQYKENSYIAFCYLLNEEERTGSYISMEFKGEHICSECIINLYNVKVLDELPIKNIEEALKDSFYMGEEGESNSNDYIVSDVVIVYYKGLPYYRFNARNDEMGDVKEGYCLAVDK